MGILVIIFLSVLFLIMFNFADIEVNGRKAKNVEKVAACFVGSFIVTIILGLPTLGFVYFFINLFIH